MTPWPDRVVLATGNPGKIEELRALLAEVDASGEVRALPEPVEDAADYVGNALIKARAAAAATGLPAIGDDGGLAVEALAGGPGLRTRRWAEGLGGWREAREALRSVVGSRATFGCGLAVCFPDGTGQAALGRVHGFVVAAQGDGPGLEPCFVADGTDRALCLLPPEIRRRVHHRGRAFDALRAGWRGGAR